MWVTFLLSHKSLPWCPSMWLQFCYSKCPCVLFDALVSFLPAPRNQGQPWKRQQNPNRYKLERFTINSSCFLARSRHFQSCLEGGCCSKTEIKKESSPQLSWSCTSEVYVCVSECVWGCCFDLPCPPLRTTARWECTVKAVLHVSSD